MGRFLKRYAASLEFSTMTDAELQAVAGDITTAAKNSALVAVTPAMQASAAAIATKSATLTTANKLVADDHVKLKADIVTAKTARTDLNGEVRSYATLASNNAKTPEDLQGAGLSNKVTLPRNSSPEVPDQPINKAPKKGHGKTVVAVPGKIRAQYVAEQSLDGVTYTPLGVGHGKTRVVTGASGTKVWVRFAMVRGQLQSDWSIALQIVIP
jgi:hypothetical protein